MPSSPPEPVTIQAPATIGNFGPGFDVTSLAIAGLGDRITLATADQDRIHVEGPGAPGIPTAWHENVAGLALDLVRKASGIDATLEVTLHKPRAPGSGLGSSASSAAGATLAFHGLFPEAELAAADLVRAAGGAEGGGASPHYDDVAAVVMGGLALVREEDGELLLGRVPLPSDLHLALVVPDLSLPTREMRALLPAQVDLSEAVANLGRVAALVDACHRGDVPALGACLEDRLATPRRKTRIPFYDAAREAALDAGAHGAALAGSGPSLFAVCDTRATAEAVAREMCTTVQAHGVDAEALAAVPEHEVPYDAAMR